MDLQYVISPKRTCPDEGVESWYPYYAGFSKNFVQSILDSGVSATSCIVDPWNGSGTTTRAAYSKGLNAYGFDLNPVMVISAKASIMPSTERPSLIPLSAEILVRAETQFEDDGSADPLTTWFTRNGCINIRRIEKAIQKILVCESDNSFLLTSARVDGLSCIAAFYYVALFRVLRKILTPFYTSNPTWIKVPKNPANKLRPTLQFVSQLFSREVKSMVGSFSEKIDKGGNVIIGVSSSESSPLSDAVADYVITSPPYCTRIDYAVATMPELTLLGFDPNHSLDELRRRLIGTSTVPKKAPTIKEHWGTECLSLLQDISRHESKASHSYYFKNHVQYFDSIYNSLGEVSRILKKNGQCILVVQDSYYKNLHNDLPKIITEMSATLGLNLSARKDFESAKNMAGINSNSKKYRSSSKAVESVLCFNK